MITLNHLPLEGLLSLTEAKTENFLSFKKFVPGKGCGEKVVICATIER